MRLVLSSSMLAATLVSAAMAVAMGTGGKSTPRGAPGLDATYVGTHRLRVNRIPGREWTGTVTITKEGGALRLAGSLHHGQHFLELSGTVEPVSARKFHLDGELRGVPDMSWADEAPRERMTRGRFTFEATGKRRFWRLYQVDGQECVCNDNCGNDFCYIDVELGKQAGDGQ
jgi:hypothetical protein